MTRSSLGLQPSLKHPLALTHSLSLSSPQVNHFSARCVAAADKPTSWGVRQIETAANFCIDSWFWSGITAGIHVQIEHHLFPSVASDKVRREGGREAGGQGERGEVKMAFDPHP